MWDRRRIVKIAKINVLASYNDAKNDVNIKKHPRLKKYEPWPKKRDFQVENEPLYDKNIPIEI